MTKQSDWIYKLIDAAKTSKVENLPPSQPYQPRAATSSPKSGSKTAGKSAPAKVKGAKTCPKCKKGQMVERTAKAGPNAGKTFLGCTNYPECKHAEPVTK
jgi:ssDNA-binding Zn-finger/Zn-ribbon topoisomerase 1